MTVYNLISVTRSGLNSI